MCAAVPQEEHEQVVFFALDLQGAQVQGERERIDLNWSCRGLLPCATVLGKRTGPAMEAKGRLPVVLTAPVKPGELKLDSAKRLDSFCGDMSV